MKWIKKEWTNSHLLNWIGKEKLNKEEKIGKMQWRTKKIVNMNVKKKVEHMFSYFNK